MNAWQNARGMSLSGSYLPQKNSAKWGFKLFAMCDASNGVLHVFEVYASQVEGGEKGLTHAVVMCLTENLHQQGYVVTADKLYTFHALATRLLEQDTYLLGRVRTNRQGLRQLMKNDTKQFNKHVDRGNTRYIRQGGHGLLFQQ